MNFGNDQEARTAQRNSGGSNKMLAGFGRGYFPISPSSRPVDVKNK